MWIDTSGKCTFVGAKHLSPVDFVVMQTILPCNRHTTSDDNSNYYNFHALRQLPIRLYNSFVILYSVGFAYMQNIDQSPFRNANKKSNLKSMIIIKNGINI